MEECSMNNTQCFFMLSVKIALGKLSLSLEVRVLADL